MNSWMTEELTPLKVTCTSTDCENGLHCYLATAKMVREEAAGRCRSCGIVLVDWNRVFRRNLDDVAFTFEAMRTEYIRHHFWHLDIDEDALEHARRMGMVKLLEGVPKRLKQSIGKANPFRDGTQTPLHGRAVYYAQHATATCCRKCVEEWHDIPRGRELTDAELGYLAQLVSLYLQSRLKAIPAKGIPSGRLKKMVATPALRKASSASRD